MRERIDSWLAEGGLFSQTNVQRAERVHRLWFAGVLIYAAGQVLRWYLS